MNVLATYTVTIEDGVVTPVGDVPQEVLGYIQEIVDQNTETMQKSTITSAYLGNYQVTLYDTGNMEMVEATEVGKTKTIWRDVPVNAPRATTINEWLQLAPKVVGSTGSTKPPNQPFVQPPRSPMDVSRAYYRRGMLAAHQRGNRRQYIPPTIGGTVVTGH